MGSKILLNELIIAFFPPTLQGCRASQRTNASFCREREFLCRPWSASRTLPRNTTRAGPSSGSPLWPVTQAIGLRWPAASDPIPSGWRESLLAVYRWNATTRRPTIVSWPFVALTFNTTMAITRRKQKRGIRKRSRRGPHRNRPALSFCVRSCTFYLSIDDRSINSTIVKLFWLTCLCNYLVYFLLACPGINYSIYSLFIQSKSFITFIDETVVVRWFFPSFCTVLVMAFHDFLTKFACFL